MKHHASTTIHRQKETQTMNTTTDNKPRVITASILFDTMVDLRADGHDSIEAVAHPALYKKLVADSRTQVHFTDFNKQDEFTLCGVLVKFSKAMAPGELVFNTDKGTRVVRYTALTTY